MWEFICEGDILVTEIKSANHVEKSIGLHIRHEKFGKLENGIAIKVNSCLIKKMKTHFF